MATKKILLLIVSLWLAVCSMHVVFAGSGPPGCTSPTVVDGYVYFANGTAVSGASMTVTTTATSCNSWTDTTDANGYYSIPGLDINGRTVTSTASISTYDGTNSSSVSGSTKRLNIWIRPKSPTLTAIADRHNGTNIIMSWTSGSEIAAGETTYDQLDNSSGSYFNKTSPQTVNLSSFATYTWRAKTCNSKICSSVSSDSFAISNTAPSSPTLPDLNYTYLDSQVFTWTSGTDSDIAPVDTLHDEFQMSNKSDYSVLIVNDTSATSPKNVSGLQMFKTYYWRVRTCDDTGASNACSSWATDNFFTYNGSEACPECAECAECPSCPASVCVGGGGGGGGSSVGAITGVSTRVSYTAIVFVPSQLEVGSNFSILMNFKSGNDLSNMTARLVTVSSIASEIVQIEHYKPNSEQEIVITGKISPELAEGAYLVSLIISVGNETISLSQFKLNIKSKVAEAICGNGVCEGSETAENCIQDCHCGNFKCESEFGENVSTCYRDCQYAPFTPTIFWTVTLTITLLAIGVHLYRDVTRKARELEKYFRARMKRGEKANDLRGKLTSLGYSKAHIEKAYTKVRKKHSKLKAK